MGSTVPADQRENHSDRSARLLGAFCVLWTAAQLVLILFGLPGLGWLLPLGLIGLLLAVGQPRKSTLRAILFSAALNLLACLFIAVMTFSGRQYVQSVTFSVQSGLSAAVARWSVSLLARLRDEDHQPGLPFDAGKVGNALGRAVRRWQQS